MPRIEKLVPVDGRLGVVLDVPPGQPGQDSVSIYTTSEVDEMLLSAKRSARDDCLAEVACWLSYYRDDCNDPDGQGAQCARHIETAIKALNKHQ